MNVCVSIQEDVSRDPESEFRDIAKYGIVQVAGESEFTGTVKYNIVQ